MPPQDTLPRTKMKTTIYVTNRVMAILVAIFSLAPAEAIEAQALYKDASQPIAARVEDLLSRMTIQEKADQLCQSVARDFNPNNHQSARNDKIQPTYGSYIYRNDVPLRNAIQKIAMEKSRLGIPAVFGSDVIHGCFLSFPIPLAQACSWNPELVRRSCSYAASEARRSGVDWVFSPMIDVTFDPRWGRIAEGYGESPYGASVFAAAAVKGYQGRTLDSPDTVACTLKHFVAYGASEGGRDYSYTDVSPVRLWEIYLPPYEAGVKAGASAIMSSFNDLNGVPVTANHYLLTEVLRKQWGFKGVVVTDWCAISQLVTQGFAEDRREGVKLAMNAGVDMDMLTFGNKDYLPQLVKEGAVSKKRVDEAVRRILRMKFELGLFEHPYVVAGDKISPERSLEGEQIAEKLAVQSLVLLKNEREILPISRQTQRIALIGPVATDKSEVLGSWRYAADANRTISIEQGLREALPASVSLQTERGCDFENDKREGFSAAIELSKKSDLVILCVGETAKMSGENASRSSLRLPGVQEELALALAETGKPVLLVISSGRPVELQRLEPKMTAILAIWQPGTKTGSAVAKVLTGACNPSGRLAVTWPRSNGQIPIFHNMHARARDEKGQGEYQDLPTTPQYEFGYGLSYTKFTYSPIVLKSQTVKPHGELLAEITVTNSGKVDGTETLFWFIHDPVASITQPIKELKRFEKADIPAGKSRVFQFTIQPQRDIAFRNGQGDSILETGTIELMTGGQKASFRVKN